MLKLLAAFVIFLPIIIAGEQEPSKAGYAPSSHQRIGERIAQMPHDVRYWRGWQRARPADDIAGLRATQGLWCDFYYHPVYSQGRLIPQAGAIDLPAEFDGVVLFLNEPDLPGQCSASPKRAAQLYTHVRNQLPHAQLVGPGISDRDWVNEFAWLEAWWTAVVDLTGEPPQMAAWDIHNYSDKAHPLAPYDALEKWLAVRGVANPKFFVSEWGACTPERIIEMREAFDNDPRILRHYIYDQTLATWDGDGRCIILFDEETMELTLLGRAWAFGE